MTTAALVAIGDELLAGAHPDLDSPEVAARLSDHGVACSEVCVLGDDEDALAARFGELCARHDLVVTSGGLGPTLDDVTRHAAARAAGVGLEVSAAARARLAEWFAARGRERVAANERQALFPAGATVLDNAAGSAPGFRVRVGECWLVCLPGPPRELSAMVDAELLPWLRAAGLAQPRRPESTFYLVGLPESLFSERAGDWMSRDADPVLGVTAKGGQLAVRLRARGSGEQGGRVLAERTAAFRERFAGWTYSESEPRLELVVANRLLERRCTVALAESCTGGLATHLLSRAPGVSAVLRGAFVPYSNDAKVEHLGVAAGLLERAGAVSPEVAAAMALGAARAARARLAVSITGVAGPDGGTPEKPVGRVCFGVALDGAAETEERTFPPAGRVAVQRFAAVAALDLLRRAAERA